MPLWDRPERTMPGQKLIQDRPNYTYERERQEAESRYPFLKNFRSISIAPALVKNKRGLGEFTHPGDPTNPRPEGYTITIGEKSGMLPGGVSDTIIADMVHAMGQTNPQFKALKRKLVDSMSTVEKVFVKRSYERTYKGRYGGSNFASLDNFLNTFWTDGIIQNLLLPNDPSSEKDLEEFKRASPKALPILNKIRALLLSDPSKKKRKVR